MGTDSSNIYNATLTEVDYETLSICIGKKIYQVYAPFIQFEDGIVSSISFSVHLGSGWLNFNSNWLSTPNDISYYKLETFRDDSPLGIDYNKKDNELLKPSSYLFNRGRSGQEIQKIEVYSKREKWQDEEIIYDFMILFYANNGLRFCINILEEISEFLECTIEETIITKNLDGVILSQTIV